ncbi:hypothetical protein ElyMa_000574600 [Elysia marginata]|uniref:Uncharacterized protein n=1 Tax=Elysia marginata TaxID=1093978 RepID=A0AAV4G4P1_9GAST|nr:hypothetical protein ElyMa_000574600 [Elysia marginata]
MKRNLLAFRKLTVLLLGVLVMTAFLAHHATQSRKYAQAREVTNNHSPTKPMKGQADLLAVQEDKKFNIEDIIVFRSHKARSRLSSGAKVTTRATAHQLSKKATGKKETTRRNSHTVDVKDMKHEQNRKSQNASYRIKMERKKVKATMQAEFGGKETGNIANIKLNKENVEENLSEAKITGHEKEPSEIRQDKQQQRPQVNEIEKIEQGGKNQRVENGAALNTLKMKESQLTKGKNHWLNQSAYHQDSSRVKYLIYLCDGHAHCYGLGDRQRGIVATYYLAELTDRRFGIIMTAPSDIRDFYQPNLVKWNVTDSDLPQNATKYELSVCIVFMYNVLGLVFSP